MTEHSYTGGDSRVDMLVIKLGGGLGISPEFLVDELVEMNERCVIVHGASGELDSVCRRMGMEPRFIESPSGHTSRYTDAAMLEVFTMVYAGLANKRLVALMQQKGINAVGLAGVDGRLLVGRRKRAIRSRVGEKTIVIRDDHSGRVERVNTALLETLLEAGYVPVVTFPALTPEGELINVDGDRAGAVIAGSLGAEEYVILTNVPGLLGNVHDPGSIVHTIPFGEIERYMGMARGRMKKKLLGAREAVEMGVMRVSISAANVESPVSKARRGHGTVISCGK